MAVFFWDSANLIQVMNRNEQASYELNLLIYQLKRVSYNPVLPVYKPHQAVYRPTQSMLQIRLMQPSLCIYSQSNK